MTHRLAIKTIICVIIMAILVLTACGRSEDETSNESHKEAASTQVRFPAEFEPAEGVTIAWPLDLPAELVKMMAENVEVYVIIDPNNSNASEEEVTEQLKKAGVDTGKVKVSTLEMVSPYLRDYGAFFVFRGIEQQIVNFDNSIEGMDPMPGERFGVAFAKELGISSEISSIRMDGGNLMSDGRGTAISDLLATRMNNRDVSKVREEMRRVMGINNHILTVDPQGGYIEHVDCWAKFLAPDKVLVAKVPKSNPRYTYYENMAGLFKSTLCCWGYPYKVYRVEEPVTEKDPADSKVAPYTNSLILNSHVYLPLGDDEEYNEKAIKVYEEALPGYEIHGFPSDGSFLEWMNTDSLHCRTHEIPDRNMVFIDHYNVLNGRVDEDFCRVEARVIPYSGSNLKDGFPKLIHRTDNGQWKEETMTRDEDAGIYTYAFNKPKSGQTIEYYIVAEDEKGNTAQQPYTGALDPHKFTIK